jgi:RimJ/RimL family protein N-acetyltransferase/predicted N-acetyltransferase YhbS
MILREHPITLTGDRVLLRPMTEDDWDILLKWNSDPQVLYFSEGDDVQAYSLEDIQGIYRGTSQTAYCFIAEVNGSPVGECWLQKMNLPRVLSKYPDQDCRRIDLMIGEKEWWGKGIGTEMIRLLTDFAFEQEHVDQVYIPEIADYNLRSQKAFLKNGYLIVEKIEQPAGMKAHFAYDLLLARRQYEVFRRGITLRNYQEEDFQAIQQLSVLEGWPTPTSRPAEARQAWQHSNPALVAVHQGQVIGFLRAITDGFVTAYIADLLVAEVWRGQGIGKALVDACHELVPLTRLDLLSSGQADRFYEVNDFRRFQGFRKSY